MMMKKYIAGILTGIMIMVGISVSAETTLNITAIFDRVKLIVNGEHTGVPTLLFEGRTYIQLQAAAEAFDAQLAWDSATLTASLTTKQANADATAIPSPAPTATETSATPSAPVHQDIPATVYVTPSGTKYHYSSTCGGKNSYVINSDQIGTRGPCAKCVK